MGQFSNYRDSNNIDMFLIVDVQGFKIAEKKFFPKELAAYDGHGVSHHIFRSPFPFYTLPKQFQEQANWLTRNHHSIPWDEGFTPAYMFPKILKRLVRNVDVVYVKGREKAEFLRTYITNPIVEIEEQPALPPSKPICMHHLTAICHCALSNVYQLHEHYVME
jgi:hypothetical protein